MRYSEPAPAKLNLALHIRGKLPDGRHALETIFAFCVDGDLVTAEKSGGSGFALECRGPFAEALEGNDNLIADAYSRLNEASGAVGGTAFTLDKRLPLASGIGGGSADAAAALRLLTRLWGIDPRLASEIAPMIGADVPACLLSMTARGTGAGDKVELIEASGISGTPVLLVNPGIQLSTRDVFAAWTGTGSGPLTSWREGRNDLEKPAQKLAPVIGDVIDWLGDRDGVSLARMSGSGATCFALFDSEQARDSAAAACSSNWWHLASFLR